MGAYTNAVEGMIKDLQPVLDELADDQRRILQYWLEKIAFDGLHWVATTRLFTVLLLRHLQRDGWVDGDRLQDFVDKQKTLFSSTGIFHYLPNDETPSWLEPIQPLMDELTNLQRPHLQQWISTLAFDGRHWIGNANGSTLMLQQVLKHNNPIDDDRLQDIISRQKDALERLEEFLQFLRNMSIGINNYYT